MRKAVFFFLIFSFFLPGIDPRNAFACDFCGCTLARSGVKAPENGKRWFFDLTTEQQNWAVKDAREAHLLHHTGHDFHDKTHEEFYHFTLGANPRPELTLFAEIPYVVRGSLEIDDHARLGQHEQSEGVGDLNLTGVYRFLRKNNDFLGAVAGLKFPTGSTKETNSQNERFEPELQPGTGSYDYTLGGAFQLEWAPVTLHGNSVYIFKTEGDAEFEHGDLFSTYLFIDTLINPESRDFKTKIGLDMNLQIEGKQTEEGVKVDDSGGNTLLLGPAVSVQANENLSVFGNFLFPVYQDLGGVHQELDFVWNAGLKAVW